MRRYVERSPTPHVLLPTIGTSKAMTFPYASDERGFRCEALREIRYLSLKATKYVFNTARSLKRTRTGGKGYAGVFERSDDDVNPVLEALEAS